MQRSQPLTNDASIESMRRAIPSAQQGAVTRTDVTRLQQVQVYPAVSVLLPTSDSIQHDRARLNSLIDSAVDRLVGEFPRPEIQSLIDDLVKLSELEDLPWGHASLALFVSSGTALAVALPVVVRQRTVVDETFATRDLVHALLRSPSYGVLVLDEDVTRLYSGLGRILGETMSESFALPDTAQDARKNRFRFGADRSALRDHQLRRYVRAVDAALSAQIRHDMPLIVVGTGRRLVAFAKRSSHQRHIVASLSGRCAGAGLQARADLADLVWPSVLEMVQRNERDAMRELDQSIGLRRCATGIHEVHSLTVDGRGQLLLVEQSYEFPARVDPETRCLTPASDVEHPDVVDDMVDEIIEYVLGKGGRVAIVPDGALARHERIAMTLRY